MSRKSPESSGGGQCGRAGRNPGHHQPEDGKSTTQGGTRWQRSPTTSGSIRTADYHQLTLMVTRTDGTVIHPAT